MIRRRETQAGFTLLELLVALAVFGLVMLGLAEATKMGVQGWAIQTREAGSATDLDAVDRLLRRLISEATSTSTSPFAGRSNTVLFLSELPDAVANGAKSARIELSVTAAGVLVMQWWIPGHGPDRDRQPLNSMQGEAVILDHVSGLNFFYHHTPNTPAEAGSGNGGWLTQWNGQGLPDLVRIHLVFQKNDPRNWPDIVIAPMAR